MGYETAEISFIAEKMKYCRERKNEGYSTILFLGAGVSITSGIPAANGIVRDIQKEFPQALKKQGDPTTYPACMEAIGEGYRKDVINKYDKNSTINLSYLSLASLVKENYVDTILTVNFDRLILKSLSLHNIYPSVYDLAVSKSFDTSSIAYPNVFYLHGQMGGFVMLNTEEECREHAERLTPLFETFESRKCCWIFVGYSGENDPVFEKLSQINEFKYDLFWVTYKDNEPGEHIVKGLLTSKGKNRYCVKGYDADSFFHKLGKELKVESKIIFSPFTYLKDTIEIIDIKKIDGQEVDVTKTTRKWIDSAIEMFEQGKFEEESDEAEKVFNDEELANKVTDIWLNDKFDEIEEAFKSVQEKNLKEVKTILSYALNNKAVALYRKKEYDKAISDYNKALELNPENEKIYIGRGVVYIMKEDFDKAITDFDIAIKLNPEHDESYINRGVAYGGKGEFDKAISDFDIGIDLNPHNDKAYTNRGNAYEDKGDYDKALSDYNKAIKLNPGNNHAVISRDKAEKLKKSKQK